MKERLSIREEQLQFLARHDPKIRGRLRLQSPAAIRKQIAHQELLARQRASKAAKNAALMQACRDRGRTPLERMEPVPAWKPTASHRVQVVLSRAGRALMRLVGLVHARRH